MDLTEYFGISVPQASLDIAKYTELAPNNLTYDRSSKTYTAAPSFRPLYQRSSAQRYLAELLATKMGWLSQLPALSDPRRRQIGLLPWRTIDEQTVELVVRAIRQQEAIRVSYQSMTSLNESIRLLSPHALGYDGFRWHARVLPQAPAFQRFRPRSNPSHRWYRAEPSGLQSGYALAYCADTDPAPHPDLPAAKKRVLELDYGMEDGQVKLPCRQAFLYYTLRRLGLHTKEAPDPLAQQIALKNRDDIQPYIDALTAQA